MVTMAMVMIVIGIMVAMMDNSDIIERWWYGDLNGDDGDGS